ncbi:TetR family transcriptional regulator [Arthrobacter sp. Sa2CUA1]|uniref:TetR family transcriptional regulator n=1 Tax=Arthrobacter gallicola TaxID=2762225 RepID=A0ABR8UU96_9MICC|nr:NUDIX domain-containing protein [Arthrobacter gallicola]MBD7996103.1 TetR family transcriptional regulator [Arthrobacter gallicola]
MARTTAARSRPRMTGTQRRAQLIGVARSLFALRGLEGATIEDIAAGAGVSKPVVYEHFGSKEALYTEVVDTEFNRLLAAVTEALGADAGPRVLLERAAYSLLDYIENHTDGFRILVRDAPPSQPEGTFSTLLSRIAADVEHILAKEFSSRGLRAEMGGMYAQMLVGMVAMTGQWWLDARSPDKATVAAHLVNLSWNGLTGLQEAPVLEHIPGGMPGGAPTVLTLSAVLVHDSEGRILLVRKRGTHRFMQPGGKLEPGEDFLQAAAREVNEELGLRVAAADLADIGHWYGPAANEANTFIDAGLFSLNLPGPFGSGADPAPQAAAEIEETLWLTPAEAFARTDLSPLLRDHLLPQLLAGETEPPG